MLFFGGKGTYNTHLKPFWHGFQLYSVTFVCTSKHTFLGVSFIGERLSKRYHIRLQSNAKIVGRWSSCNGNHLLEIFVLDWQIVSNLVWGPVLCQQFQDVELIFLYYIERFRPSFFCFRSCCYRHFGIQKVISNDKICIPKTFFPWWARCAIMTFWIRRMHAW